MGGGGTGRVDGWIGEGIGEVIEGGFLRFIGIFIGNSLFEDYPTYTGGEY